MSENIDQEKFDFYAKDPVDLRFVGCTFRNVTGSGKRGQTSQFKDCKFYGCDTRSVQDRSVFTHAALFPADAAVRSPERRESKYIPADMIELARSQDVFGHPPAHRGAAVPEGTDSGALWSMTVW